MTRRSLLYVSIFAGIICAVAPGSTLAKKKGIVDAATGERIDRNAEAKSLSKGIIAVPGADMIVSTFTTPASAAIGDVITLQLDAWLTNIGTVTQDASVDDFTFNVFIMNNTNFINDPPTNQYAVLLDQLVINTGLFPPGVPVQLDLTSLWIGVPFLDSWVGEVYLGATVAAVDLEDDATNNRTLQPITVNDIPKECAYYEDFQDGDGGYVAVDVTAGIENTWHQENYDHGDGAGLRGVAYCGKYDATFANSPGSGNNWTMIMEKQFTLAAFGAGVEYEFRYDSEPGYDFTRLQISNDFGATFTDIAVYDGGSNGDGSFIQNFHDLSLWAGETVTLRWIFTSDAAWSDQDGLWTTIYGPAMIDWITVGTDAGPATDNFNAGLDGWSIPLAPGTSPTMLTLTEDPYCPFGDNCDVYLNDAARPGVFCNAWVGDDPVTHMFPFAAPTAPQPITIGVVSPVINLPGDQDRLRISFDVFGYLPLENGVFFSFNVREPGGPWIPAQYIYWKSTSGWSRGIYDLGPLGTGGVFASASQIQIRIEAKEVRGYNNTGVHQTGPYFDNIAIVVGNNATPTGVDCSTYPRPCGFNAADTDADGVDNGVDLEPDVSSAPFDRDGDGVKDDIHGARHIEYWRDGSFPLEYRIDSGGAPGVNFVDLENAIAGAFNAWTGPDVDLSFTYGGPIAQPNADALDGLNTITFNDPDFVFPNGVLAVGISTSFTEPTDFLGTIRRPNEICDSDMIFNPGVAFKTPSSGPVNGTDIQGTATHEAGHLIGISHSSVVTSTMFYVLPPDAATLEEEDRTTVLKSYYNAAVAAGGSRVLGTVTDGYTMNPIGGAIVFAINAASGDTSGCEYTLPDGTYQFLGLADGNYVISVYPLNKTSPIGFIGPENINEIIFGNTFSAFKPEDYNIGDSETDAPGAQTQISVSAGATLSNIDIITDIDNTPPSIVNRSPTPGETDVVVDAAILVAFDEAIDGSSLNGNFALEDLATLTFVPGNAALLDDDRTLAFVPADILNFGEAYQVRLETGVTDVFGNGLAAQEIWQFTVEAQPPVAVTGLAPNKGGAGTTVAINGFGFEPSPTQMRVLFDGVPIVPLDGNPNQLIFQVPDIAPEGGHSVQVQNLVTFELSNVLTYTVVVDEEIARGFDYGSATLAGSPNTLIVSPDGSLALVATDEGATSVVVDPAVPNYLTLTNVAVPGGMEDIAVTPDGNHAFAVSRVNEKVYRFNANPANGPFTVLSETDVSYIPRGIVLSRSGRRAFVSTGGGEIRIWDTRESSPTFDREIGTIVSPFATLQRGMAVTPASDRLLALSGEAKMVVFDIRQNLFLQSVDVGPLPRDVAVDPSGERAYVTDDNGFVTIVRLDDYSRVQDVQTGGQLRGASVTSAGGYLYAVNRALDFLDVIDLRETSPLFRTVALRIPQERDPSDVVFSPDGAYAYATLESGNVLQITAVGIGPTMRSLDPPKGRAGDLLVIGGESFVENSINTVSFTGADASPVNVSERSLTVVVPATAGSGPILLRGTSAGGTNVQSNELYYEVLGSSGAGQLKLSGQVTSTFGALTPTLAVTALRSIAVVGGTSGALGVVDVDPGSNTFNKILATPAAHTAAVTDVAVTPAGDRAYSVAAGDAFVRVVDIRRGSSTFGLVIDSINLPNPDSSLVAMSPDGNLLLVGESAAATVRVIDLAQSSPTYHQIIATFSSVDGALGNNGVVGEMHFHPGGRYAYMCVQDTDPAVVTVFDVDPGGTPGVIGSVQLPIGAPDEVPVSLAFTPDGTQCLVLTSQLSGAPNRTVATLDCTSPDTPNLIGSQAFAATLVASDDHIEVSPRGDRAIINIRGDGFHHLDITGAPSLTELDQLPGSIHTQPLTFAYAADGKRVFAADVNGSNVSAFDFSGEDRTLAAVSGGGQTAIVGQAFASPVRVRITGVATGTGVAGIPVTFSATAGGGGFVAGDGTVVGSIVVATDASGYSQAKWSAGPLVGVDSQVAEASAVGVQNSPASFLGTTVDDPDLLPLVLSSLTPADGRNGASVSTSVQASFSRAVDPLSVLSATFYLLDTVTSTKVPALIGFSDGNRRASLTPASPLAFSRAYAVTVTNLILDVDGGVLQNPSTNIFTTSSPPPLTITSLNPPAATQNVDVVIAGQGFDTTSPSSNTVTFAGVQAIVREVSPGYITAAVPLGAASGNVVVQTTTQTSNALTFAVLEPAAVPVDDVLGDVGTGSTTRAITVTPDGGLAFAVAPNANLVVAIDLKKFRTIANIDVGETPYAITMHPTGERAYVANLVDGTVSVIGTDRQNEDFNQVVETMIVGLGPVDIDVSPVGDRVIVANAGSATLSVIDAEITSDTFHRVLSSPRTETNVRTITASPDGGRWYVGTESGYVVIDPLSYAVLANGNTGSTTRATTITPDGGLLIVLTVLGKLFVFDVAEGSPSENQVLASTRETTTVRAMACSPDGAYLYVVPDESDKLLVFSLSFKKGVSVLGSDQVGTTLDLDPIAEIPTGENPSNVTIDPSGSGQVLVTNEGEPTITIIDSDPGVIEAEVIVDAQDLGVGVMTTIELGTAFDPNDVNVDSLVLSGSGSVYAVPNSRSIADTDGDGIAEVHIAFDRVQFQQVIPEGDVVPLTVSGVVGSFAFSGVDTIVTHRPQVTAPTNVVDVDTDVIVSWMTPPTANADSAEVYWTDDEGATWTPIVASMPDTGMVVWHTPSVAADAARIMVRLRRDGGPIGSGMSAETFMIASTIPVRLSAFQGTMERGAAVLRWSTSTESGLQGFLVMRAVERDPLVIVSPDVISARGKGTDYEWRDTGVRPNQTYRYALAEVQDDGGLRMLRETELRYRVPFALEQNVPNPFNPTTTIIYSLPEDTKVRLVVYDVAGRRVRTLVDTFQRSNYYEVEWDGTNERGQHVSSGVYFYRITAGKFSKARKMLMLK